MTKKQTTDPASVPAASTTFCRRVPRPLPIAEHAGCPYCFGKEAEIENGEHARFCDFKPGVDPVHFGFPPDSSRNLES